jgi:hypothetical protein
MTVKGFDALYEDPEDRSGASSPLPGTDAYLAFVAERKRREKEKTKRDAEVSPLLGQDDTLTGITEGTLPRTIPDRSTGIPHASIPPTIPVPSTGIAAGTVPARLPLPSTIPVEEEQEVEITQNFMRFDLDIFGLLPTLSEGELRIYLDFVRRSYGQSPPRNTCFVTRRKIGDTAGVSSPNAQVTIIQRLEHKGLIKRISTAQGKNQASKFRVFLPCEIPGHTSNTTLRYPSSNPSS